MDLFKKIGSRLLKEYDIKKGIKWMLWQFIDSISIKSLLEEEEVKTGNNPTDRSKMGTKGTF
jgi:hypothetical protein